MCVGIWVKSRYKKFMPQCKDKELALKTILAIWYPLLAPLSQS